MLVLGLAALALLWQFASEPLKELLGFSHTVESHGDDESSSSGAAVDGFTVELTPEKVADIRLTTSPVVRRTLRPEEVVPGRVDFDATRRLAITAPVDCVVDQVLIEPGAAVKKGDRLVILQSSDVGLARDEIGKCEADLRLAKRELEYAEDILANIQALLAELKTEPDYEAVAAAFSEKRLGVHREHLLSAYSKLNLARKTMEESHELAASGAVSGRIAQQRKSELEVAAAAFDSQRETTLFECLQDRDKAAASAARAERMLEIARSNLAALLGGLQIEMPASGQNLSELIVISPIDGRIEAQAPVRYARLKAGDPLLTIADASLLWITAAVREREWHASSMKPGDEARVRIPALGNELRVAKVRFIGAEVSAETRTLPVVLEIDNADGLLRPGMSVWATLAVGQPREALLIPASAVMRHEEQPFVFITESPTRFRRIDIVPGAEQLNEEQLLEVEVREGLKEGDQVVVNGAFILKSELLLEKEE